MRPNTSNRRVISASSAVIALLAAWLIVTPWMIGAPGARVATNGIICGALILTCSWIRFAYRHTSALSWINALVGAWVIGAAWVFGENSADVRTWNYSIVGVVVALLEAISLTSSAMRPHTSAGNRLSTKNQR